ncbi:hypothetical protein B0J11DRAFT_483769 [Dendryphion nanum]|uniref:Uncharacterized protein n=1 Tax=Dendryphion nanum TaxID=256645 RepID=A0A9P9IPT1_9PLEO|nr:hypothetical protein B0J11DRAFT_483769 [Dendryphion nanum]
MAHHDTTIADLGRANFDAVVAEATDRDTALNLNTALHIPKKAPAAGREREVFAWNKFHHVDEHKNEKEELKGDLHGGQLHRANRMARGEVPGYGGGNQPVGMDGGRGGRGGIMRGAMMRGARGGGREDMPPQAKGWAVELNKDLFWDEKIV